MTFLVLGARGMVGSRISAELVRRGHPVVKASRSGADNTMKLNANDVSALKDALKENDIQVLVVATAPDLSEGAPRVKDTFMGILEACRSSTDNTKRRVFFVGGAGSLNLPGDKGRLIDSFPPDLPPFVKQKSLQHVEALPLLQETKDVPWTYLSPPIKILPDLPKTGKYKLGKDEVVGVQMSVDDYALAAVDEIENPKHTYQRFSVGSFD